MEKKRIILAESDPTLVEVLTYLLRSWDYEVKVISDGQSVLEEVHQRHPDLIIIDAELRSLDGLAVSKTLKSDFITAHIPIIILIEKRRIRKKMLEIEQGVDDYILSPPDPIDLEVRMEMVLRSSEHQFHASALTKLPGGKTIEKIIDVRLKRASPFSVAYLDIDNFKSFNDTYGYIRGDAAIQQLAHIISLVVKERGNADDFVGHVGGDDFIVVTTPDKEEAIASSCIAKFDRLIPYHYSREDRARGYIVATDRSGGVVRVPLMSVSVAIVNNKTAPISNIIELTEVAAEIKHYLKKLPGSNYLSNRRVKDTGKELRLKKPRPAEKGSKKTVPPALDEADASPPLGQRCIDLQMIDEEQLREALEEHWHTGQRLGQVLIKKGWVSSKAIISILTEQLKVPHIDTQALGVDESLCKLLPASVREQRSVLPVRKEDSRLLVAMVEPVNPKLLKNLRQETGLEIVPYLIMEDEISRVFQRAALQKE